MTIYDYYLSDCEKCPKMPFIFVLRRFGLIFDVQKYNYFPTFSLPLLQKKSIKYGILRINHYLCIENKENNGEKEETITDIREHYHH